MPAPADPRPSDRIPFDPPVVLALLRLQHQLESTLAGTAPDLADGPVDPARGAPPRRPHPPRGPWDRRPRGSDADRGARGPAGPV